MREIKIEYFKSQKNGKHNFMGSSSFTLADVKGERNNYQITNPKNGQKKGQVFFKQVQFNKRHTFLEYVFGGCDISLAIAVDFTLSNLAPTDKDSLHYFDLNKNEYL